MAVGSWVSDRHSVVRGTMFVGSVRPLRLSFQLFASAR